MIKTSARAAVVGLLALLSTAAALPAHATADPEIQGGGCATPIKAVRATWGNQVGIRAGMTAANDCRWIMRARVHCQGSPTYYRRGSIVTRAGYISEAKCDTSDGYYGKQGYEYSPPPYKEWIFVSI